MSPIIESHKYSLSTERSNNRPAYPIRSRDDGYDSLGPDNTPLPPATLDPSVIWATVDPNPPPYYTPTIPLHASTLAPLPTSGTTITTSENQEQNDKHSGQNIILTVICIFISLLLISVTIWELKRCRRRSGHKNPPATLFTFRIPKLERAHNAKNVDWALQRGTTTYIPSADNVEMSTALNDKSSQSSVKGGSRNGRTNPSLPASYSLPWEIPSNRASCPPASSMFVVANPDYHTRATSLTLEMDRSLLRSNNPSMKEDPYDLFIGQHPNDSSSSDMDLDSQDSFEFESASSETKSLPMSLVSTESISTLLHLAQAGMHSAEKRLLTTRPRNGSGASETTQTSSNYSDGVSGASSTISLATLVSDMDDDIEGAEGEETFVIKRVTNSMEVGKGVLLALEKTQGRDTIPDIPRLEIPKPVLSRAEKVLPNLPHPSFVGGGRDDLLHPMLNTKSSCSSLGTSASISVDLDDFPSPPTANTLIPSIVCTHSTDLGPVNFMYQ